jgi:hypothetical protein
MLDAGQRKAFPVAEARTVLAAVVGAPLCTDEIRQTAAARTASYGAAALEALTAAIFCETTEGGAGRAAQPGRWNCGFPQEGGEEQPQHHRGDSLMALARYDTAIYIF